MIQRISPEQAQELAKQGAKIVDVREPHEWQGGHVPGATHVPLGSFVRDPLAHVGEGKTLFICAHGQRSLTAAMVSERAGAPGELYNVEGGTVGWARAGLPISRER